MPTKTTDAQYIYEVKVLGKTLKISFLAISIKTGKICPNCKNQKKVLRVYKILNKKIKDKNNNLLCDEEPKKIDFTKVKKQINKKLFEETLVCMNCCPRIFGTKTSEDIFLFI